MPPIAVQIATGPGTTRRESFNETILSFGRGGDNEITLSLPTASRRHGEIRYENGQWWLVNLSPNGTRLDGRSVTKKPVALHDRDTVSIGDKPVFQVFLDDSAAAAAPVTNAPPETPPSNTRAMSGRAKIWIGIGVYLMVMTVILIVAEQFLNNDSAESAQLAPELATAQIHDAILKPAQVGVTDPRQAVQELETATQLFNKLDTAPGNLYQSYNAYRLALAYAGRDVFADGLDQRRFQETQNQLTDLVDRLYHEGYIQLRRGAFKEAEATFRKLEQEVYQDPDSPIYKNVEQQRRAAAEGLRKQNQ